MLKLLRLALLFPALLGTAAASESAKGRDGSHDFDFEIGTWKTQVKRPVKPLTALLWLCSAAFLSACVAADPVLPVAPDTPQVVRQGFHIEILFAPRVARMRDATHLVYELHLTNLARIPLAPTRIQAFDQDSGALVHELGQTSLLSSLAPIVTSAPAIQDGAVLPGAHAVVYVNSPVEAVPRRLRHTVSYDVRGPTGSEAASVDGGEVGVASSQLPRLGPPLRGGPWVAVYDPALERGHRRVVYAVSGRAQIPGRFAIDWMRPAEESDGRGSEVLAVADAVVAATRDGVAEPDPTQRAQPAPLGDATGNYVALALDDGVYAFYEHLAPGLRVRVGDRVRRGQVIGAVGSTGQAQQPHLHFHLADRLSPLGAEGIPYSLDGMEALGAYESLQTFARGGSWRSDDRRHGVYFPDPMLVVAFPEVR